MTKKQINIILADDMKEYHNLLKDMVSEANESSSDLKLEIVKCFFNTSDLKRYLYEKNKADLLLLDLDFQGGERGTQALQKIKAYAPDLVVIILTGDDDSSKISPYLGERVKYLSKDELNWNKFLIKINEIKDKIK